MVEWRRERDDRKSLVYFLIVSGLSENRGPSSNTPFFCSISPGISGENYVGFSLFHVTFFEKNSEPLDDVQPFFLGRDSLATNLNVTSLNTI
jgi:hypothetical protein